jgi:hypothetical protein
MGDRSLSFITMIWGVNRMWSQFRQLWTTSIVFQAAAAVVVIGLAVLATNSVSSLVPNQVVSPITTPQPDDPPAKTTGIVRGTGKIARGAATAVLKEGKDLLDEAGSAVGRAANAVGGPPWP